MTNAPLLEVRGLVKEFSLPHSDKVVHACSDIDLVLRPGETLGVIGESGSGKTTLGRCVLRLLEPTSGEIRFQNQDVTQLDREGLRRLRQHVQIVFQEPFDSLNPQMTIARQVAEPLRIHSDLTRSQRRDRSLELLQMVGLPPSAGDALPRAMSPGAMQRASIARAIATDPEVIVLDEPTSALSPEAEIAIISLLEDLQDRLGLAYIFISHDMSLVRSICDRRLPGARLEGEIPSPIDLPEGCFLASRCPFAQERCRAEPQQLRAVPGAGDQHSRCWRMVEGDLTEVELAQAARDAGSFTPPSSEETPPA